jgi:GT2 family glycosyltransferase
MLRDCLTRLAVQTFRDFETIVIDSSSDESTAALLAEWPEVRSVRIRGARNNMPQARNAGIAEARGEIVAFLDDDSMASQEWLAELVTGYQGADVGGAGGRVVDERLRTPGEARIGAVGGDGALVANFAADPGDSLEVGWLPGCNMSYARKALAAAGPFDARYTGDNSFEEVDYAVRVRKAGFRLFYVPRAVVTHLAARRGPGQVHRNHLSPRTRFYKARNETYFCLKNMGPGRVVRGRLLAETYGKLAYASRHPRARLLLGSLAMVAGRLVGATVWATWRLRRRRLGGGC